MACAIEPIGLDRDGDGALLDAAVTLVCLVMAGQPVKRCIGEIAFDLAPYGGLVGLDGEEIVSTFIADGLGDGRVGGDGVDGDECALEAVTGGQPSSSSVPAIGSGFAALLRRCFLAEHQP